MKCCVDSSFLPSYPAIEQKVRKSESKDIVLNKDKNKIKNKPH